MSPHHVVLHDPGATGMLLAALSQICIYLTDQVSNIVVQLDRLIVRFIQLVNLGGPPPGSFQELTPDRRPLLFFLCLRPEMVRMPTLTAVLPAGSHPLTGHESSATVAHVPARDAANHRGWQARHAYKAFQTPGQRPLNRSLRCPPSECDV